MKYHKTPLLSAFLCAATAWAAPIDQDELPKIIDYTTPSVSRNHHAPDAVVHLLIEINEYGYVTNASVKSASEPALAGPSLAAIRHWRYAPAMKDGAPIAARFVQPLRFASDNVTIVSLASHPAKVRRRVPPRIPAGLEHLNAEITVEFHLDKYGKVENTMVVSSTAHELDDATTDAALQWKFSPAVEFGQPVHSTVYVPFRFQGNPSLALRPTKVVKLADNDQLVPLRQINPRLDAELFLLDGKVKVAFTVTEKGYVIDAKAISYFHERLAALSVQAMRNGRFKPVVHDGTPVAISAVQPFVYGSGKIAMVPVDRLPTVRRTVSPQIPTELEGVDGFAQVVFVVDAKGQVAEVAINESSHNAFSAPRSRCRQRLAIQSCPS
ncbi:MAG: TonB family protein [Candidatus Synoicihabitans palmerolidicus]|nr:TonB family protein [Candidatus Synoicihabitans palmerolidicus]